MANIFEDFEPPSKKFLATPLKAYMESSLNQLQTFAGSVSWQSVRSGYVKQNTWAIITPAHNQALRMNWINTNIAGVDCSPLCRVCQSVDESSKYIASGWKQLAKRRYMIWLIATLVHWELCRSFGIDIKVTNNWYEHVPYIAITRDYSIVTKEKLKKMKRWPNI